MWWNEKANVSNGSGVLMIRVNILLACITKCRVIVTAADNGIDLY